jgi:hypothetical protein
VSIASARRTVCFSRAATFTAGHSLQNYAHNQIVPRYKAAKRRRLQAVLGGGEMSNKPLLQWRIAKPIHSSNVLENPPHLL